MPMNTPPEHAIKFFHTLFWHNRGLIDVKALAPKRMPGRRFCEDPLEAANHALEINRLGYNMFCGVNPRATPGGTEDDVHQVFTLFLDLDLKKGANPKATYDKLAAAGIGPSMTVVSGNGAHFYMMLREPANPVEAKLAGQRLCKGTDSDAVHNINRIARIPGTVNWKDPPTWCFIAEITDRRYSLDELMTAMDRMGMEQVVPEPPKAEVMTDQEKPLFLDWPDLRRKLDGRVLALIDGIASVDEATSAPTRSEADWLVVCGLITGGATNDQIEWIYKTQEIGKLKYREAGERYLAQTIKAARHKLAPPARSRRYWAVASRNSIGAGWR